MSNQSHNAGDTAQLEAAEGVVAAQEGEGGPGPAGGGSIVALLEAGVV
jgi:hypothetical protein